jgi:hypothetical protein
VLNKETIKEREAFCLLKDEWNRLSKCQPNLLIPLKRKKKTLLSKRSLTKTSLAKALSSLAKTAAVAVRMAVAAEMSKLLLTPSIQRLFLSKKAKTPALGSLIKSLIKAPRPRKAPVPRKTATDQIAKA